MKFLKMMDTITIKSDHIMNEISQNDGHHNNRVSTHYKKNSQNYGAVTKSMDDLWKKFLVMIGNITIET